jgi:hypothetical protein
MFTDNSGVPGDQVAGTNWEFQDTSTPGDVVSITGISGVTLTGGDEYFLVLEPLATDGFSPGM